MRIHSSLVAAALAGAVVPLAASTAGAAGMPDAALTVVHGIPATNVDVYVNGKLTLNDFTFGTVTKPLPLPAGTYQVAIRPHGAAASSKAILSGTEHLVSGENATIVANLTAAGKPTLSVFANPTASIPAGEARVIVRHEAAAPPVDVYAGSTKVTSSLANGNQKVLVIPAAKNDPIAVTVAGQPLNRAVLGPVKLSFAAGTTTVVYAIGSASGKALKAVAQTYKG